MSDDGNLEAGKVAIFGPFRLTAAERLLERDGQPVVVGSRALDILIVLLERRGKVVSQRELVERVWPNLMVEGAGLRVHVAHLRKVLGDGQDGARYITNVTGRGYCFVAPIRLELAAAQLTIPVIAGNDSLEGLTPPRLPPQLARMIGREETITALSATLSSRRFVSVIGTGGLGKTTVAVSVAHALFDEFSGAVYFVDLGALTNAALIPSAIATVLGFQAQAHDPLSSVLSFLADRRVLLILDNCEHMIEAAAIVAERIYDDAPQVYLLITSREALRVEGEHVHRLLPLENPPDIPNLTAEQALASPAVQLFVDRATASGHRYELGDADAPVVADICRRLDGIALAIELVASRVGTYGLAGTAELLDSRFRLLLRGRRTALPRHQTLHAMLDWSYALLSERDRRVLCRLSVFVGVFTLAGAQAVASDEDLDALNAADAVSSLVDKSLISVSVVDGTTYHRLLDTTHTFVAVKLAESLEGSTVAKRHALYYSERLPPETNNTSIYNGRQLLACAPHLSNVRAALEWAFSNMGDTVIGVELAARATPLFLGLALLSEGQRWCERALEMLNDRDRGTRRELALQEALAISSMYTRGGRSEVRAAIERGLALAEALGESQHQLHLLAGLKIFAARIGDFAGALAVARRYSAIAGGIDDPPGVVVAEWMLGAAHHLIGDQAAAHQHYETGFRLAASSRPACVNYFGYDHRTAALAGTARVSWLRGMPEQALGIARQAIDEAADRGQPVTLCSTLLDCIPVFIWAAEIGDVGERIDRLIAHAAKYSLAPYHAGGLALKGELAIVREQATAGVKLLRGALQILDAEQYHVSITGFYRALAEGLLKCGKTGEAASMIDVALTRAKRRGKTFDMPDLLRARGEILLAGSQPDLVAAEEALLKSLQCAREQSSLSYELRAAIALSRVWLSQARSAEAREMLTGVYRRFSEGFGTADLKSAGRLLEQLDTILVRPKPGLELP